MKRGRNKKLPRLSSQLYAHTHSIFPSLQIVLLDRTALKEIGLFTIVLKYAMIWKYVVNNRERGEKR